ncbi:MAG: DegV family protein, partial [Clostridia bacterium]|nr:DegV family protein [Clostridia bacterium]
MYNYVIIPDTSCDLIKPLRERFEIDDFISGLVYFPDGHCEKSDLDWERHDPKEFFESMSDKKMVYKTACAPAGDIIDVFERQLQAGNDIIC